MARTKRYGRAQRRKPAVAAFRALLPPETRNLAAMVQMATCPEALLGFLLSRGLSARDALDVSRPAAPVGFASSSSEPKSS